MNIKYRILLLKGTFIKTEMKERVKNKKKKDIMVVESGQLRIIRKIKVKNDKPKKSENRSSNTENLFSSFKFTVFIFSPSETLQITSDEGLILSKIKLNR